MKKTFHQPPGMENTAECPDSNALSAFVEGSISTEGRDSIIYHLKRCKDCYQLVVETVKLVRDLPEEIRESEPVYPVFEPVSHPEERKIPAFLSKFGKLQNAALLSPVAAIFLFTILFKGGPDWNTDQVLNALTHDNAIVVVSQSLPLTEDNQRVTLGFNQSMSDQKLAFKTGTLLSRLEISRMAGDLNRGKIYSEHLINLLQSTDTTRKYLPLELENLNKNLDEVEKQFLNSSLDFYFKLGVFVESGKAYSIVDKSELFDKNYLKTLLDHPQFDSLPPGVARRFKEIERLLTKNSVARDYEIIYKLLQDIQQILS